MSYAPALPWAAPAAFLQRPLRRVVQLVLTLLPLMALLVGSCKMSQLPWAYGSNASSEQFRTALFPDRVGYIGNDYYPAAGYISRARAFVAGSPQSLNMLTQKEIGYLFGKPTLHRQDAYAEVWQYKAGGCVVDLYFYNDRGTPGETPVAYVDVRPGDAGDVSGASMEEASGCLRDIAARRRFMSLFG